MRRLALVLAAMAALLALPGLANDAPPDSGALVVTLRAQADAAAEQPLTIAELAELSGPGADGAAALTVGTAPGPGRARVVLPAELRRALEQSGIPGATIRFAGAPYVRVRGAGQPLDLERVRAAVSATLAARADGEVKLLSLSLPQNALMPPGAYELRADPPAAGISSGTLLVPVIAQAPGGSPRRFTATARVEVTAEVLVATRDLLPGEAVDDGDVRVEPRPLRRGEANLRDPAEVAGLTLRTPLRRGDPVPARAVMRRCAVEPGQPVQVLVRQGGIELELSSIARGRGNPGDTVTVDGADRKPIRARVVAPGRVVVETPPAPDPAQEKP
ncbi:MAG: flagellar basal body P-ring formation protein FlgA [Acidobacteria bacterium]|nr:flagellar basal body P-ring formation protein FlgA [Acidobacteriota bacterium]